MEDVGPLVTTFEVPTITFYDGCNFRRAATVFTVPGADDVALKNTFIQEHAPADFDFDSSSACSPRTCQPTAFFRPGLTANAHRRFQRQGLQGELRRPVPHDT